MMDTLLLKLALLDDDEKRILMDYILHNKKPYVTVEEWHSARTLIKFGLIKKTVLEETTEVLKRDFSTNPPNMITEKAHKMKYELGKSGMMLKEMLK